MTTIVSLVHSGDSIGADTGSYFYQGLDTPSVGDSGVVLMQASSTYYSEAASVPLIARNMAIAGTRLGGTSPNLNALAPVYIDPIIPIGYSVPPFDSARQYIFTCAIGSNDGALGGFATPELYAGAVAACCQARKSAGYTLAGMCTLLPRGDGVMTEPNRTAYNSTLTGAGWAAENDIDYIIDLASQAIMGNPANCTNLTYYQSDTIHPTVAGWALLAPIYLAGVNALIALL